MTVEERRRRRFSESFRKEQVQLIETGQVTTSEVARMYQVKAENVRRWVKKYGTKPQPKQIVIHSSDDYNRLRELEKDNQKLKEHLGEQFVQLEYYKKLVEIAKERLGSDFEKKI